MIQVDKPDIENGIMGVYLIVFDNNYGYVGASKDLKKRISIWCRILKYNLGISDRMRLLMPTFKNAHIKIIEIVKNKKELKTIEGYYITYGVQLGLFKNRLNTNSSFSGAIKNDDPHNEYGGRFIPQITRKPIIDVVMETLLERDGHNLNKHLYLLILKGYMICTGDKYEPCLSYIYAKIEIGLPNKYLPSLEEMLPKIKFNEWLWNRW